MYKLSAATLNLLSDCPKCYWLLMKKSIRRPRGPFSTIPSKMDSIIKNYFEKYRMLNELPPILNGQLKGRLARDMPRTLQCNYSGDVTLMGRPDDFIELDNHVIDPIDHKTASRAPTEAHPSYQRQMGVYSLIMKEMGFKTTRKGYLIYFHPDDCDLHQGMIMHCTVLELNANANQIKKLIDQAVDILDGPLPESGENCPYCMYTEQLKSVFREWPNHGL